MNERCLNISLWHCKSRLLDLGHARLGAVKVTLYLSKIIILISNCINCNMGYELYELRASRPHSRYVGKEKLWVYADWWSQSWICFEQEVRQDCLADWISQSFCNSTISNKVSKQYSKENRNPSIKFFQHILLSHLKT